jgi:hypothetical protein
VGIIERQPGVTAGAQAVAHQQVDHPVALAVATSHHGDPAGARHPSRIT